VFGHDICNETPSLSAAGDIKFFICGGEELDKVFTTSINFAAGTTHKIPLRLEIMFKQPLSECG